MHEDVVKCESLSGLHEYLGDEVFRFTQHRRLTNSISSRKLVIEFENILANLVFVVAAPWIEGCLTKEHVEEQHSQAPDVDRLIVLGLLVHLIGHVGRSAQTLSGTLPLQVDQLNCKAEVSKVRVELFARFIAVDENILGLDVSVDDSLAMESADSANHLVEYAFGFQLRQTPRLRVNTPDVRSQIAHWVVGEDQTHAELITEDVHQRDATFHVLSLLQKTDLVHDIFEDLLFSNLIRHHSFYADQSESDTVSR